MPLLCIEHLPAQPIFFIDPDCPVRPKFSPDLCSGTGLYENKLGHSERRRLEMCSVEHIQWSMQSNGAVFYVFKEEKMNSFELNLSNKSSASMNHRSLIAEVRWGSKCPKDAGSTLSIGDSFNLKSLKSIMSRKGS